MNETYEYRDSPDGKRITVCFLTQDGVSYAVGQAICSRKDGFKRSMGRIIAKGRAEKCLRTGKTIFTRSGNFVYASGLTGIAIC
jgi:hypothetical protein